MDATLTVVSGPLAGRSIPHQQGKFLIGRDQDCQCLLDDLSVSRHHCVLILDDWTLRIRDLKSKNGTLVNRKRIGAWEVVLSDRDEISVGSFVARVEVGVEISAEDDREIELARGTKIIGSDTTQFGETVSKPTEIADQH